MSLIILEEKNKEIAEHTFKTFPHFYFDVINVLNIQSNLISVQGNLIVSTKEQNLTYFIILFQDSGHPLNYFIIAIKLFIM